MNAAPLLQRILSDAIIPGWHNAPESMKSLQNPLQECCKKYGLKLSDVAIAYATAHADIASTIIGMCDEENVVNNTKALDCEIPPDLMAEIDALAAPVRNLMWYEGMPENNLP
jgi:L-galactose dehydrogenase